MTNLSERFKNLLRIIRFTFSNAEHVNHMVGYVRKLERKELEFSEDLNQLQNKLAESQKAFSDVECHIKAIRKKHNVKIDIIKHIELHQTLL